MEVARRCFELVEATFEELGDRDKVANTLQNRAILARERGRPEEAGQ